MSLLHRFVRFSAARATVLTCLLVATPGALVLANVGGRPGFHDDPAFLALFRGVFPDFGTRAGQTLILRASLHSGAPASPPLSGLINRH